MEDVLDGDDVGPVHRQLAREPVVQRPQPVLDRVLLREREHAVREVPQPRAPAVLDDAEAAEAGAGIDPEDAHASFYARDSSAANSSSGMSKFA